MLGIIPWRQCRTCTRSVYLRSSIKMIRSTPSWQVSNAGGMARAVGVAVLGPGHIAERIRDAPYGPSLSTAVD